MASLTGLEHSSLSLLSPLGDYSNDGFQFAEWRSDFVDVSESQIELSLLILFYFVE